MPARGRAGGQTRGVQWGLLHSSHPQDESSESEDHKNSESEDESGEESDEEDRDGDVDPGFREQLMAVLQAGKALVSRSSGARPCLSARAQRPGCSLGICCSGWSR